VREFVEKAFAIINIHLMWRGQGLDEEGFDANAPDRVLVKIDAMYFRPTEVDLLIGNPSKAERELGWKSLTSFDQLVKEMVEGDLMLVSP
jgi:GDPmannose 4,6-dehydratase